MDIEKIIDSCQYENENSRVDFAKWLKAISPKFENKNIEKVLEDKTQLCKLFYLQKNSGVSRTNYQKIKKYIQSLLSHYNLNTPIPSREDVLKSRTLVFFYKDLGTLIRTIDYIGESSLLNYNSVNDLLNIKSIAILGWYGFSLSDMADVEKKSINCINNKYYVNKTEIDSESYRILKTFSAACEYRQFPSGKNYSYKGDDKYLFRATNSNQPINADALKLSLSRFNKEAASFGYAITFRHLKRNALFVEISQDELEESFNDKVQKAIGADKRTIYGVRKEYKQWKENERLAPLPVEKKFKQKRTGVALSVDEIRELAIEAGLLSK